eukprot:SAG31_NODE_43893_length_265_cov_0.626506_2_plen_23_part_01
MRASVGWIDTQELQEWAELIDLV